MQVRYSHNNSGGRWWLTDDDWRALEAAGWYVPWGGLYFCHSPYAFSDRPEGKLEPCEDAANCHGHRRFDSADEVDAYGSKGRYLGALAKEATREGLTLRQAIEEWERITYANSADLGCSCCGTPHHFEFKGDNGEVEFYSPDFPTVGNRYGE